MNDLTTGEKLRIYRRRFNVTAWDIARKIGIATSIYYSVERGQVELTQKELAKLPAEVNQLGELTPGERLSVHLWRRGGQKKFCSDTGINPSRLSAICNGAIPWETEKATIYNIIKGMRGAW